ncbi:hypothetical protein BJX96DRAFT_114512 [Aspergillus floccosus]
MSHVFPACPKQKRLPYTPDRLHSLVEIRPKGSLATMAISNSVKCRKRQHADAQKCQRDRMKVALDQIARVMKTGGVGDELTSVTKAKLLETAVEYIQHLQDEVKELRESCHSRHATSSTVDSVIGSVEKRG